MNDFFHGWRRKLGLLTLSLACLTMLAWMRSTVTQDWWLVRLPDQQSRPSTIGKDVTTGRTLVWLSSTARYGFTWSAERTQSRMTWVAGWHSSPVDVDFDPTNSACKYSDTIKDYRWHLLGFEAAGYHGYDQGEFESFSFWRISYPSIVLILTLTSLGLLLPLARTFVLRSSSNVRQQGISSPQTHDRLEESTTIFNQRIATAGHHAPDSHGHTNDLLAS